MVVTTSVRDFARLNGNELRYMVASLCVRHKIQNVDDMIQEVYAWFIEKNILERFDPHYMKNGKSVKLSTFLYSVIENVIRGKKINNEGQISQNRFIPPSRKYKNGNQYVDDVELALRYNDMATEYEGIVEQNDVSDSLEGLGYEMLDFEKNFLVAENKTYTLSRRKDKTIETSGTNLVEIFQLFKHGYSSREVSRMYGVSDMFISNLKREIADALRAYGLGPRGELPFKKKKLESWLNKGLPFP